LNYENDVIEVQMKYEESKKRVHQLLQQSDEHSHILKHAESERQRKEDQIRLLENKNLKLKSRLQTLTIQIEEYKLQAEDRISKIADEVSESKARANALENQSMQDLNCKLKSLQRAFVDLSDRCKGEKGIRKKLVKKQTQRKKKLDELTKENMILKDHILATSPRKKRKKLKKKRVRPWIPGNKTTFSVPAKVSKKLRKKNMKPKKKKGKSKRGRRKVVKMPRICFGEEEIIGDEYNEAKI